MSFDWSDYLRLAIGLHGSPDVPGPNEAAFRSAASRAYYAAYHLVTIRAKEDGFVPIDSGEDHELLRSFLKRGDTPRKKMSLDLERLHRLRKKADYDDAVAPATPTNLACNAINMAQKIIDEIGSLH
jgi:hypothetical protein